MARLRSSPRFPLPLLLSAAIFCMSSTAGAQAITNCGEGCARAALACGASSAGELAPSDCKEGSRFVDIWEFQLPSRMEVEIRVTGSGFTPRVTVNGTHPEVPCFEVARGDGCETGNPRVACVRMQATTVVYLVAVTSEGEGETGAYTIEASCGSIRCDDACRRGVVPCGGTVSGNLGAGNGCPAAIGGSFDTWDLDLPGERKVEITSTSASPLLVSLHYPDPFSGRGCLELAAPRACAAGSCLELIVGPGTTHVSVSAPSPGGTYEISVSCEEFDACRSCAVEGSIACGSTVSGRLGAEDCEVAIKSETGGIRLRTERWALHVTERTLFRVRSISQGFFFTRIVEREGCSPVLGIEGCNDPDPPPGSSCKLVELDPGAYWIVATTQGDGEPPPLDYSLSIECVDQGPCRHCLRGSLACGQASAGRLGDGLEACRAAGGARLDVWSFTYEGPPADVAFKVRSTAFAPRIVLLDRACEEISRSDACAMDPQAACVTSFLNGRQTVFVGVTSAAREAAGDYEIEVSCETFTPCAPRCVEGDLRLGEAVEGELTPDDCRPDQVTRADAWTLALDAPAVLDLYVEAEGFTPRLDILDSDCNPLFLDGFAEHSFARGIGGLAAGSYRVIVQNEAGLPGAPGRYTLKARPLRDCEACAGTPAACAADGSLEGVLAEGDCVDEDGFIYDAFDLDLPAARQISIRGGSGLGVLVHLFKEGCRRIFSIRNAGDGGGVGALLEAGRYRVVVSSFSPRETGSWSLSFPCKEAPFCSASCIAGNIQCGVPAQGVITREDCAYFATLIDTWRLEVPPGGASVRVREGGSGSLFFGAFPATCEAAERLEELCEPDASGAFFCDLPAGSYLLNVTTTTNVVFQEGDQPYTIEVVTAACGLFGDQLPGDCNQDGKLDLADGVCLLSHLFRGEPSAVFCEPGGPGLAGRKLLDWNGDRTLNLTDPIALLVHLFQSGPPHVLGSECVPAAGCPGACGV